MPCIAERCGDGSWHTLLIPRLILLLQGSLVGALREGNYADCGVCPVLLEEVVAGANVKVRKCHSQGNTSLFASRSSA